MKKLFLERAEMTESVSKKAEEKLVEYTKTSDYSNSLVKSAKEVAKLFADNDCVVYVNERDMKNSDKIKAVFAGSTEVVADKSIKIGGIKGFCKAMNIVADETLDSKLYAQREWFIENSGLSVLN